MRFLYTPVLSVLSTLSIAATIYQEKPTIESRTPKAQYDAIIVGGGPAGLAALSGLARVRRNVLLIGSGDYRNGPTRHMHDVLGFDGVTPAYYRWAARRQISYYDTVSMINGTVTEIESRENNTWFSVSVDCPGKAEAKMTARKVVLATGLRDILPETPGIKGNWGNGIYWCPWCDGYEHSDQPLGLLAPLSGVARLVREILTLNTDIVAFVNGTDTSEIRALADKDLPRWEDYLKINNVRIENRTIEDIVRLRNGATGSEDPSLPTVPEYDWFNVEFSEGEPIGRAAFLASFSDEQKSKVGEKAGVKLVDGLLSANQSSGLITNIPGIYAVGDANSDDISNVPHALFTGKRSAVFLHVQIAREDQAEQLGDEPEKRDVHLEPREIWETMNGKPGDLLYAGEFEQ